MASLLARGDAAMSLGQIGAARDWYRAAAERGSADGARRLAETYDADFLMQHGAIGTPGDPEQEKVWMERAQKLEKEQSSVR